jgi:hypothetical protein
MPSHSLPDLTAPSDFKFRKIPKFVIPDWVRMPQVSLFKLPKERPTQIRRPGFIFGILDLKLEYKPSRYEKTTRILPADVDNPVSLLSVQHILPSS